MSCVLEVHELWKSYAVGVRGCSARIRVLRGVSLRLAHGEQVGILGAPGAGKTTLLHCIAGLRLPDAGLVRVVDDAAVRIRLLDEGVESGDPQPTDAAYWDRLQRRIDDRAATRGGP